jgi:membrane protease YdiL (CAAX protease family)
MGTLSLRLLPLFFLAFLAQPARAELDYHGVGWVNTFVPGAGEALLGNYGMAALQAGLEIGTFWEGYKLSRLSPLTLDGVPEDLPSADTGIVRRRNSRGIVSGSRNNRLVQRALVADWLQEFGIKYHMANVYNAYRQAGAEVDSRLDGHSTSELFLSPFRWENLSSPWVYPALAVTAAAMIYQYQQDVRDPGLPRTVRLNMASQRMYDFTYLGVFPAGSGAPEEMFYRGFVQNETGALGGSAAVSIALTAMAYAFSHSANDRLSAGVTGLYLSWMTHENQGQIGRAIAYHFWSDVFAGIYQTFLVRREQRKPPLFGFSWKF